VAIAPARPWRDGPRPLVNEFLSGIGGEYRFVMPSKVYSAAVVGVEAFEVEIEVHAGLGQRRSDRGSWTAGRRGGGKWRLAPHRPLPESAMTILM
jgi:hypothetical protein